MKKLFFTSNTKHYHKINGRKVPNEIDNTNGIVDQIKQLIVAIMQYYILLLVQTIAKKLIIMLP
mgnify:CR=1 FL=1